MPNHVLNEVVLHGVSLERAGQHVLNEAGEIDFGVLLPLPLHYWPGDVSTVHEKHFSVNHLDEARRVWGTKWNAYGQGDARYKSIREIDGSLVLTFQSAWNHPRGWICALFQTLKCNISAKWASEGGNGGIEEWDWPQIEKMFGDPWKLEEISDDHPEHRRLYELMHGPRDEEDGQ